MVEYIKSSYIYTRVKNDYLLKELQKMNKTKVIAALANH